MTGALPAAYHGHVATLQVRKPIDGAAAALAFSGDGAVQQTTPLIHVSTLRLHASQYDAHVSIGGWKPQHAHAHNHAYRGERGLHLRDLQQQCTRIIVVLLIDRPALLKLTQLPRHHFLHVLDELAAAISRRCGCAVVESRQQATRGCVVGEHLLPEVRVGDIDLNVRVLSGKGVLLDREPGRRRLHLHLVGITLHTTSNSSTWHKQCVRRGLGRWECATPTRAYRKQVFDVCFTEHPGSFIVFITKQQPVRALA